MPIWTTDYQTSPRVQAMDSAESGAFLHLLMAQWDSPSDRLAFDERGLRQVARWRPEFDAIGCSFPKVLACFAKRGKWIFNEKLRRVKRQGQEYRGEISRKRKEAALERWAGDANADANADAIAIQREESEREGEPLLFPGMAPEGEEVLEYTPQFERFWSEYPRKAKKGDAFKAWCQVRKLRPPLEELLAKLRILKATHQWTKDGGEFVLYPATWLRAHGWHDEPGSVGKSEAPIPAHLGYMNPNRSKDTPEHRLYLAYQLETDPVEKERLRVEFDALTATRPEGM